MSQLIVLMLLPPYLVCRDEYACKAYIHPELLYRCILLRFCLFLGHIPAEDPHHSLVFCLHAGDKVGGLPVVLAAHPHGWNLSGAGAVPQRLSCPALHHHHRHFGLRHRLEVCSHLACLCLDPCSGPLASKPTVGRRS